MYRLTWCTDIHLNFLRFAGASKAFGEYITKETHCDAVLVTGDVSEAPVLEQHLEELEAGVACPLYFVLGNHDYYRGSFEAGHEIARTFEGWLNEKAPVELTPTTALVGHEGWYDAVLGQPFSKRFGGMSDWYIIKDLTGLTRKDLVEKCRKVSRAYAEAARSSLEAALKSYDCVIFATHYPPYKEATWHEGAMSEPEWLPWFSSAWMGEVLTELATANPQKNILVLCGHTHGSGRFRPRPNLHVLTGEAIYGAPDVAGIIEIQDSEMIVKQRLNRQVLSFNPFSLQRGAP